MRNATRAEAAAVSSMIWTTTVANSLAMPHTT
jgi:hypothetical protein